MGEFPEGQLLSDQPLGLLADASLPSVAGPALLVGLASHCSMCIVDGEWLGTVAPPFRALALGSMVLVTVAVVWVGAIWVHWSAITAQRIRCSQ